MARILVFTKAPVPGQVKTRLTPRLSPEQAARVHLALLQRTVGVAAGASLAGVELWVADDPENEPNDGGRISPSQSFEGHGTEHRMLCSRELAVGALELRLAGVAGDPQNLVVVTLRHWVASAATLGAMQGGISLIRPPRARRTGPRSFCK